LFPIGILTQAPHYAFILYTYRKERTKKSATVAMNDVKLPQ